jgi:signal transduction histidine kinase
MESGAALWRNTPTDYAEIIRQSAAAMEGELSLKPHITLSTHIPPALPRLNLDAHRLQQVLLNLLHNAIKFTETGTITLKTWIEGDRLYTSVTDTGMGIPDKDFERIFEKFEQASNTNTLTDKPSGTGLGLAICKQIIEHYGGQILVESRLHQGSTFRFFLPLSPLIHEATS